MIHDIRESRVYQEAGEECRQQIRRQVISALTADGMSPFEIATALELDTDEVRQAIADAPTDECLLITPTTPSA